MPYYPDPFNSRLYEMTPMDHQQFRIEIALIQGRGIRPLYSTAPAIHPFSYPYLYPHLPEDPGFPIVQQAAEYDQLPTTLLWT
jgi:hypothetical protein